MSEYSLPHYFEPGEHSLALGESFSPHNISRGPIINAIECEKVLLGNDAGGDYRFWFKLLDDQSKLTWDRQMSMRVSARVLGVKAKATYGTKERIESTERILTLEVGAEVVFGDEKAKNVRLSSDALKALDSGKGLSVTKYGTHYIDRATKGCRLTAFVTFNNISRSVKNKMTASFSASGYGSGISTQLSEIFEETVRRSSVSIEVSTIGTTPPADLISALTAATQEKNGSDFYGKLGSAVGIMTATSSKPIRFYHRSLADIDERIRFGNSWADEQERHLQWLWETYAKLDIDKEFIRQISEGEPPFGPLYEEQKNDLSLFPGVKYRSPWSEEQPADLTVKETLQEIEIYQENIRESHRAILDDPQNASLAKPEKKYYVSFGGYIIHKVDPFIHEVVESVVGTPKLRFEFNAVLANGQLRSLSSSQTELILSSKRYNRLDTLQRLIGPVTSYQVNLVMSGTKTALILLRNRWSSGEVFEQESPNGAPSIAPFSSYRDGRYHDGKEADILEYALQRKKGDWWVSQSYVFKDVGGREFEVEWFNCNFTNTAKGPRGKYSLADDEILAECLL